MKIWHESVSEHSMNLVMIGSFKDTQEAEKVKEIIDKFTEYARDNEEYLNAQVDYYNDSLSALMISTSIHCIHPTEIEQFYYNVHVDTKENQIILDTDEIDISAFIKILILKGARVEIYSAHDHQESASKNTSK